MTFVEEIELNLFQYAISDIFWLSVCVCEKFRNILTMNVNSIRLIGCKETLYAQLHTPQYWGKARFLYFFLFLVAFSLYTYIFIFNLTISCCHTKCVTLSHSSKIFHFLSIFPPIPSSRLNLAYVQKCKLASKWWQMIYFSRSSNRCHHWRYFFYPKRCFLSLSISLFIIVGEVEKLSLFSKKFDPKEFCLHQKLPKHQNMIYSLSSLSDLTSQFSQIVLIYCIKKGMCASLYRGFRGFPRHLFHFIYDVLFVVVYMKYCNVA